MNHENMKMTEVGWIPKDWEVKELCEVANLKSGKSIDFKTTPMGHYPCFGGNGIRCHVNIYSHEGLFPIIGRQGELCGNVNFAIGKFYATEHAIVCTPKKDINPLWLFHVLDKADINQHKTGNAQPGISVEKINHAVILPTPSPTEQRLIAQVLSDTDSLIASLSRTIEKKRLVKQGAMQQLLTGKTRLKGFSGEWVEKVIGNIGKTYNGITGKTKADFGCGNARYITFLNVLNNPIIDINILERVNINFDEGQNEVRRGDLFFNTSSETPEEVGICATLKQNVEEVYLNSFCFGFRISDEDVDNQYLAYYFRSEQGRALMTMLAQGATRYNLSKDNFNKSCIVLPPTRDEQQAIANILTTMDNEIASLEAELQKYKFLKQGMMQKLLTGQIRLKLHYGKR